MRYNSPHGQDLLRRLPSMTKTPTWHRNSFEVDTWAPQWQFSVSLELLRETQASSQLAYLTVSYCFCPPAASVTVRWHSFQSGGQKGSQFHYSPSWQSDDCNKTNKQNQWIIFSRAGVSPFNATLWRHTLAVIVAHGDDLTRQNPLPTWRRCYRRQFWQRFRTACLDTSGMWPTALRRNLFVRYF